MSIRPKTIASDLVDEINRLLNQGHYYPADSEEITSFFDRIGKLDENAPNEARALRSLAYQLCGNADAALDQCRALTSENGRNPAIDRLCVLSNLGRATEGLEFFQKAGSPDTGNFTTAVAAGLAFGAFRTLGQFIHKAKTMRLSNMDGVPQQTILAAAQILQEHETSDDQIAATVSVAGDVLRDHGLFYLGDPRVDTFEEQGMVRLCYRLAVTPSQATTLYGDFLDRLDDADISVPAGFLLAFEGVEMRAEELYA